MANGYKTVGSRHPKYKKCPICGRNDWCCTYPGEYMDVQVEYLMCNRGQANKGDIIGSLKCVGHIKYKGVPTFVELSQIPADGQSGIIKSSAYIPPKVTFNVVERFKDQKLDIMYKKMLSLLKLEDYHEAKLIADGITAEMIQHYGIKSFPMSDKERRDKNIQSINPKRSQLAREMHNLYGDLTGLPGAYIVEYKDSRYWTLTGQEGIIFPIPNVYGEIVMCQIRLDNPGNSGKYKAFSSDDKVE
ncbi:MAG: hypothetical protein K0Q87_5350, partial [Neobacillus sp.]|nr:hypothetical protein [Neobacillus sp.]